MSFKNRNANRQEGSLTRSLHGRLFDGILVNSEKRQRLMVEASPHRNGRLESTKFREDRLKLAKDLHALYRQLEMDYGAQKLQDLRLQVFGILELGPQWHVYSLQAHDHMTCFRLRLDITVPTYKDYIEDFVLVLESVFALRRYVQETETALKKIQSENRGKPRTEMPMTISNLTTPKKRKASGK